MSSIGSRWIDYLVTVDTSDQGVFYYKDKSSHIVTPNTEVN